MFKFLIILMLIASPVFAKAPQYTKNPDGTVTQNFNPPDPRNLTPEEVKSRYLGLVNTLADLKSTEVELQAEIDSLVIAEPNAAVNSAAADVNAVIP